MDFKKREKRFKCDECSSAFTHTSGLETHKSSAHSELRPFQCEHCDYSAKLKPALMHHYATHFPQMYKTQSCLKCSYKCSTPSELQTHLRVHTKEKPFACKLCPYRASVRYSLTVHTRTHTGEKPFKCSLCALTFSQSSLLNSHKKFVHDLKNVSQFDCRLVGCNRKFASKHSLQKHVESFHNKERHFSCPHCQKSFYEKSNCASHIRRRHTTERPYKCSVCDYAAATSSEVRRHESTTHRECKAVECPVCHKKYKNDQSLTTHHKYAHSNAEGSKKPAQQWKCKEPGCTKEFKTRSGLNQHVKCFHLQQKPFKCLYCDHATTSSDMLNVHLNTHTQERPYSCNKCKHCFVSSSDLSKHKATAHSELRPLQCEQCCYSAKTEAYLTQHQKIHEPRPTTLERNICKESRGSKRSKQTTPSEQNVAQVLI